MEQTIDIKKLNEEVKALKLEVAQIREELDFEKVPEFSEEENLKFAKDTEEAWKDVEEGRFKKMSPEEFLEEIRSFK